MNTVVATIDQASLNVVLGKITLTETKDWSGEIVLVHWNVTVKFDVSNLHATIANGQVEVFARVHVTAGPVSYTHDNVEAVVTIGMDGAQVLLSITSLEVPVYVKPFGDEVDLGDFDVCSLSGPIEVRVKVLPGPETSTLPGGAQMTITTSNPQIAVLPGGIQASATLSVA
jgi:hypothetical protein